MFMRFSVAMCFGLLLLAGCNQQPTDPNPPPNPDAPAPPADDKTKLPMTPPLGPKFLTATTTQLAQAFIDDPGKAYRHYGAQPVQIIGVITKREMGVAYMKVAGKNKEEKAVDWEFVLVFPKTINMDGVTVGKSLTLRGTFATTGIGTSTIDVNVVVGQ